MSKTIGEQLGCDNAVFMSQIADAYESEDHVVGPETTLAVRSLRATLLRLKYSAEPRDQDALRSIDANFMDLDDVSYSDDEPHSFDPGRNLTGRLTRANRQQFADFAVWYSGRIVQIGMQLERDQPELQADALQRTDNLIRCGIFPKSASALMQRSAEWAGSFTPIGSVEQVANSNVGYCYEGGVGIANMYGLPYFPDVITLQMKQTTFHDVKLPLSRTLCLFPAVLA